MSHLSERALAQALTELLEERPLDRITVQDITDKCGLSRNTFYYHFHDVYELLSRIFTSETERLIARYEENRDWAGGFDDGLNFLYAHRKMINHVYKSINRELLNRYLHEIVFRHALVLVRTESQNFPVSENTIAIVANFYMNAIIGAVIGWIERGMTESPQSLARLYNCMFVGTIEAALKSAEKGLQ